MHKRDKVRISLIGCGNVSGTYLYSLTRNENVEVVSVVDPDIKKAVNKAQAYGIRTIFRDYPSALENSSLDAVVIASPHYLHHEQALRCANNGLDILCEKPLATNMKDIQEMVDFCDNNGVRFGVMLQRSFYPNTLAAKEAVKNNLLGEIKYASLKFRTNKSPEFYQTWRGKKISGGGVLISQTLHRIAQLTDIFGSPISVQGTTKTTRDYIEVEDYAKGTVNFDKATVEIEANNSDLSATGQTISEIHLIGTLGEIILSDDKTPLWDVKGMDSPPEISLSAIPEPHRPAYYGPGHELIINDFVNSIIENRKPLVSGKDSINSMKVIFGFYESAKNNGILIKL